jgi:hypothetical protein
VLSDLSPKFLQGLPDVGEFTWCLASHFLRTFVDKGSGYRAIAAPLKAFKGPGGMGAG